MTARSGTSSRGPEGFQDSLGDNLRMAEDDEVAGVYNANIVWMLFDPLAGVGAAIASV